MTGRCTGLAADSISMDPPSQGCARRGRRYRSSAWASPSRRNAPYRSSPATSCSTASSPSAAWYGSATTNPEERAMRFLLLGDVVGKTGRDAVVRELPRLRRELALDFVAVNGESAAHGFGITPQICAELYAAGTDVITTGNHVWDRKKIVPYIGGDPRLLRPLNFPVGTPGKGAGVFALKDGRKMVVANAMARLFMDALDDPFAAVDAFLAEQPLGKGTSILLDFHGEASSEKTAMGYYCDGRERIVQRVHEKPRHGVRHHHLAAVLERKHARALARRAGRKIQRPQQAWIAADIGNDLLAVPDVIAGGDDVGAGGVELGADLRRDAEAMRRVLAVDGDEIERQLAPQARQFAHHRIASRLAHHVAQQQKPHRPFLRVCCRGTIPRRAR